MFAVCVRLSNSMAFQILHIQTLRELWIQCHPVKPATSGEILRGNGMEARQLCWSPVQFLPVAAQGRNLCWSCWSVAVFSGPSQKYDNLTWFHCEFQDVSLWVSQCFSQRFLNPRHILRNCEAICFQDLLAIANTVIAGTPVLRFRRINEINRINQILYPQIRWDVKICQVQLTNVKFIVYINTVIYIDILLSM
jgi:hypothetical protein